MYKKKIGFSFSFIICLFFCSSKLNRARHNKCKTRVYMYFFLILQFPMRKNAVGYKSIEEWGARVNVKTTFMHFEHDKNRSKRTIQRESYYNLYYIHKE